MITASPSIIPPQMKMIEAVAPPKVRVIEYYNNPEQIWKITAECVLCGAVTMRRIERNGKLESSYFKPCPCHVIRK